jgi:WG containing repeat
MKKQSAFYSLFIVALFALIVSGCSLTDAIFSESEAPITHLPVKLNKSGRWGFVDMKGEMICEDEFKNKPSAAINNITQVRNDKDEIEYYRIGKRVEQIGDSYLYGTVYTGGIAMVVKENGYITAIDENGKELFTLDGKDEEAILVAGNFHGKLAPVMNAKNEWGYIDADGNISIKCQFEKAEAFHDGYARVSREDKIMFIDKAGNVVYEPKSMNKLSRVQEDAFVYAEEGREFGLMDLKGEKIIKANSKYAFMAPPQHEIVVFAAEANSEFGVMDLKGEIILRPKYDFIMINDKLIFAFMRGKNTTVFDHSGKELWKLDVDGIIPISSETGVAIDGNDMELVSLEDGKTLGKETFADIGINLNDILQTLSGSGLFSWAEFVSSDYADPDGALSKVLSQLKAKDFYGAGQNGGYAQARKAIEAVNALHREFSSTSMNGTDDRVFWALGNKEETAEEAAMAMAARDQAAISAEVATEMAAEMATEMDTTAIGSSLELAAPTGEPMPQLKTPEIKDKAPELNSYQSTLYTNTVQIDRKLSFTMTIEFNERLKTEVYRDFFNGYYSVPNTLMGYDINPNAKITAIRINFDASGNDGPEAVDQGIAERLKTLGFKIDVSGNYENQGVNARFNDGSLGLLYPIPVVAPVVTVTR